MKPTDADREAARSESAAEIADCIREGCREAGLDPTRHLSPEVGVRQLVAEIVALKQSSAAFTGAVLTELSADPEHWMRGEPDVDRVLEAVCALKVRIDESERALSAASGRADFNDTRAIEAESQLRDLRRAWPTDPRYVNATPDREYPIRILTAHIDESACVGEGGAEVLATVMNEAQQERNAILRQAIQLIRVAIGD